MNYLCGAKPFVLFFSFFSPFVLSAQNDNDNVFNSESDMIVRPDNENYKKTMSSGSIYEIAIDKENSLIYASWGYRLGTNPMVGIVAFDIDTLKAKGFIKNIRDVYGLAFDAKNNRLLAEHTVTRKIGDGDFLQGNSFDVISLANGRKLIDTVEVDKDKKDRDYFNSHYIFPIEDGGVILSSESKPKKGGPENMQKITKYNSSGHELWQSKPFPGLVAALISDQKIIAGSNDLYEIDMRDGSINPALYAKRPLNDEARYMALAQGKGVVYATSFIHLSENDLTTKKQPYKNIYVIEKGKPATGFSTVSFDQSFGIGSTGLAFNAETNQLYTANFNDSTISIINTKNPRDLNDYKNIRLKDSWGVNSIAYNNHDGKVDIYVGIKGGHGKNVKHTEQDADDVKLAKITINSKFFEPLSWCKISVFDIKSDRYDYYNTDCDVLN